MVNEKTIFDVADEPEQNFTIIAASSNMKTVEAVGCGIDSKVCACIIREGIIGLRGIFHE